MTEKEFEKIAEMGVVAGRIIDLVYGSASFGRRGDAARFNQCVDDLNRMLEEIIVMVDHEGPCHASKQRRGPWPSEQDWRAQTKRRIR